MAPPLAHTPLWLTDATCSLTLIGNTNKPLMMAHATWLTDSVTEWLTNPDTQAWHMVNKPLSIDDDTWLTIADIQPCVKVNNTHTINDVLVLLIKVNDSMLLAPWLREVVNRELPMQHGTWLMVSSFSSLVLLTLIIKVNDRRLSVRRSVRRASGVAWCISIGSLVMALVWCTCARARWRNW